MVQVGEELRLKFLRKKTLEKPNVESVRGEPQDDEGARKGLNRQIVKSRARSKNKTNVQPVDGVLRRSQHCSGAWNSLELSPTAPW